LSALFSDIFTLLSTAAGFNSIRMYLHLKKQKLFLPCSMEHLPKIHIGLDFIPKMNTMIVIFPSERMAVL